MITIYGIKNCDTIKKTLKWFDSKSTNYHFVDYKKNPPTQELISLFLSEHPWDTIINKRGTTWRKLDEDTKLNMNSELAVQVILEQPSIVKRPIIIKKDSIWVGYDENIFEQII